jgi:hypothetical protein
MNYEIKNGNRGVVVKKKTPSGKFYYVTSKCRNRQLPTKILKLYDQFNQNMKLYNELMAVPLNTVSFINFPQGLKSGIRYTTKKYQPRDLKWISVKCKNEIKSGPFTLKSGCDVGKSAQKVFVKGYRNLRDLSSALQRKDVSREQFLDLMVDIEELGGTDNTMINENFEINILHFKFIG